MEEDSLYFVRYAECVPASDEVDEVIKCLCLHWVTAGSGKKSRDVKKEGNDRDAGAGGE